MKLERGSIPIDVSRELVEEALIVASRNAGSELQAAFRDEMEAVQSIEIVDVREHRFEALDSQWMERLRVTEALESVLARLPAVGDVVSTCTLELARSKADERAFLSDADETIASAGAHKPALIVQLTVDTLMAEDKLDPLLRMTLAKARRPS